jgi:DNA-binding response OmpR family regulator
MRTEPEQGGAILILLSPMYHPRRMEQSRDVLVVDDDKAINIVLCRFLQKVGFTVRSALNGTAALEEARSSPPLLVLLDLMLPDISGFDVCEELKRDERTRSVPIVMVTAMVDDESRERGLACGAVAYLTKPFDPDQLIGTVKTLADRA